MHAHIPETLTRRGFLQAGTVASLTGLAAFARAEDKKDPFGGFTVGMQSYTFRNFDTEQALKRTHDLGLHFVEFYNKHAVPGSSPEQLQALLRLCKQYDIK